MGLYRRKVGARLRQLRKAAGLTQEQLGRRAGMDYKYLGSVERGERNITLDNLERITRALGVEPFEPFAFAVKADAPRPATDSILVNLVRRAGPDVRPLAMEIVQSLLRWAAAKPR
jgi:transcriptional regulator with XRE-family HTH domain